jgi:vitamin B12 transporter
VIQIFTKSKRATPTVDVTAGLGSYATRTVRGAANATFGNTDLTFSAGFFETDGFSATNPSVSFGRFNPDDDGYRNSNFSTKLAHRFNPRNEAGASVFYSEGKAHFDNGPTTDNRTDQKLSVYSIYSQNQITGAWQSLVRIGASRDDSASLGAATVSKFKTDQSQATWQNTFTLAKDISLIAGAEYLKQEVDTTTAYVVTQRTIKSAFAGLNADYGNHGVQASVRRDDNSQFGAPTTGSIAYGYRITPAMRVRGAYGTAFHAPSFNDLYFPGFGNPDVKPERSRNREVGVDYQAGGQRFTATYFDNRITDLIVFFFNPETSVFGPENLSKARIRGTELSYTARFFEAQLRAKLTLQDPEVRPTGLQLQRRARRHGSLMAMRAFGPWRVGAEVVASGERFDSATESPASRLAGYALFNLTLARSLTPEWSVDLRWNNVADKEYELIQGYNVPGSNVLLSLRWTPLR